MPAAVRPVALVTGASAGIGATFARALAVRGYDLILAARRKDRLEALAQELTGKCNIECRVLVADLASDAGMETVASCIAAEDRLELLVNNAGFGVSGTYWEQPVQGQLDMHRLHVLAAARLTHAGLAAMVKRGHGGVINVASVAGFVQAPGATSYGATKRWMVAFTEGLHMELRRVSSPVRIQALCPGFTYSEFHDVAHMDRATIAKSLWMQPEFVVEASLRGLDEGKWIVIPGWRYKLLVRLLAITPGFALRWASTRVSRRRGR